MFPLPSYLLFTLIFFLVISSSNLLSIFGFSHFLLLFSGFWDTFLSFLGHGKSPLCHSGLRNPCLLLHTKRTVGRSRCGLLVASISIASSKVPHTESSRLKFKVFLGILSFLRLRTSSLSAFASGGLALFAVLPSFCLLAVFFQNLLSTPAPKGEGAKLGTLKEVR